MATIQDRVSKRMLNSRVTARRTISGGKGGNTAITIRCVGSQIIHQKISKLFKFRRPYSNGIPSLCAASPLAGKSGNRPKGVSIMVPHPRRRLIDLQMPSSLKAKKPGYPRRAVFILSLCHLREISRAEIVATPVTRSRPAWPQRLLGAQAFIEPGGSRNPAVP